MSSEKLEPRLANFLEEKKVRGTAAGLGLAVIAEEPIAVTISHHENLQAEEGGDRDAAAKDLEARIERSQAPILAKLEELGAEAKVHALTNAVTTKLTAAQLDEVAELDEVKILRLESSDPVTCMNESPTLIEAPEARQELRVNGDGVKVAVLDTGVEATHPALLGKVVDSINLAGGGPGSHGTHVAGTIASNDPVFRGVAFQSGIIDIQVLTAFGFGVPANVITGLDQAVRRGAKVANLSLGWSEIFHGWVCDDADCILCQAADNAVRLGVTVVVAAGNEGNIVPGDNVRHPGAARRVITVGAVDKAKSLAGFSSIGPGSGRLSPGSPIRLTKPDVSGPGVAITSSVVGGGFAALSGTSMASPHVAAVAALVLQKNPNLTPMMVKKILEETAEPLTDTTPNDVGYGLVNAFGAVLRAQGLIP